MPDDADPPGLRLEAVRGWLDRAGVGLDCSAPLTATLFPGGRSNVTYLLMDSSGGCAVLRRPPLGNVLPTAHDMAREYRVLSGLARTGFPAPAPLALCEDADVTGAPFLVMGYVPGRIIATADDAVALSPQERTDISASLIATLAALHAVDLDSAGLADLGRPQGFLPRQLSRWATQWELTRTRDLASMDRLRQRLELSIAALPDDLPSSLVHGDYRLDNVILGPDGAEIRAVLDWEMSTLGDPLADLGLMLVYWSRPDDRMRRVIPVAQGVTGAPGFADRGQLVDLYAAATGHSLHHLDACTALACYKLAVITESIHARALSGKQLGAGADDMHAMGEATVALATLGEQVMEHGAVAGLAS
ncbi:MAG: phosphotransferase family protein [Actinomycetes bacterium]